MTKTALADDDGEDFYPVCSLTPTMELIMEVLAGRYRLGESLWPFASNSTSNIAANRLQANGLVIKDNGNVENTFRLYLTPKGIRERELDRPYTPPNAGKTTISGGGVTLTAGGGVGGGGGGGGFSRGIGTTFIGSGGPGHGPGIPITYPVARTTKTRADDWKSGFDAGWAAREGQPR